jgi:hypothetical protein
MRDYLALRAAKFVVPKVLLQESLSDGHEHADSVDMLPQRNMPLDSVNREESAIPEPVCLVAHRLLRPLRPGKHIL